MHDMQGSGDWCVRTYDESTHTFVDAGRAMAYALSQAWVNKGTTVISPAGEEWVVLRRHHEVSVHVVRTV